MDDQTPSVPRQGPQQVSLPRARIALTLILGYHGVLFVLTIALMLLVRSGRIDFPSQDFRVLVYCALFGLLGSLIYFSRKCYVYLITNKLGKLLRQMEQDAPSGATAIDEVRAAFLGYYLYLLVRPFAGVVIGPVLYMLAVSGLATFGGTSSSAADPPAVSRAGRYVLYSLSFLGGHASSDMFDYFTWLAKRLIIKKGRDDD